jgi:hypothetical protein
LGTGLSSLFALGDSAVLTFRYEPSRIVMINLATKDSTVISDSARYETSFALSPEKNKLVYYHQYDYHLVPNNDTISIATVDLLSLSKKKLAANGSAGVDFYSSLCWSKSGNIYYEGRTSPASRSIQIFKVKSDGTGEKQITNSTGSCYHPEVSGDTQNERVVFEEMDMTGSNLWLYDALKDSLSVLKRLDSQMIYRNGYSSDYSKIVVNTVNDDAMISVYDLNSHAYNFFTAGTNPICRIDTYMSVMDIAHEQAVRLLFQNYPNPFSKKTTFTFSLPERSFVTLKIFNLKGTEVSQLFGRKLYEKGTYAVHFKAADLQSGVYFCRLSAENGNGSYGLTRKMIFRQ